MQGPVPTPHHRVEDGRATFRREPWHGARHLIDGIPRRRELLVTGTQSQNFHQLSHREVVIVPVRLICRARLIDAFRKRLQMQAPRTEGLFRDEISGVQRRLNLSHIGQNHNPHIA